VARGLLAIFVVVFTALVIRPDAAHAADTADLWCSLSPQALRAAPGASVSVAVTCGNHGPSTAVNSVLVYTYPEGTTLGPLPSGWGQESSTAAGITVGSLASGDTVRATFTIMVPGSATVGSGLQQQVQVLPGTTDPNPGNDSASGQLVVAAAPAPTSAAPTASTAAPRHRPATTKPTAATSGPTSPAPSPERPATSTAPLAPGGDPSGSVAALSLPSEAAGQPSPGSDPDSQGSGLSLLALALIVGGALLIVGGAVAALLLRRRGAGPAAGQGGTVADRPATDSWQS
jgi:hypothetical protein